MFIPHGSTASVMCLYVVHSGTTNTTTTSTTSTAYAIALYILHVGEESVITLILGRAFCSEKFAKYSGMIADCDRCT